MKKTLLLFVFAGLASVTLAQTLFSYGNNTVDKSEFLRAYERNKVPVADKEKALREYLDLYVKFKLKVKAAMELGLDTMPQLLFDAQSFRDQIADSYLNNDKALNQLIDEAFARSQKDIHIIHFFVASDAALSPEDSMKAFKSINSIYSGLGAGKTDYEKIGEATSAKASYSDLGFITTFSLPYEYENIVYGLKPGQASKPYRSKKGWHVFKSLEERKAVGKWKIAQILFSIPPDATEPERVQIKKRADSVYQLLQKGEDFGRMARWFSDDKMTYGNNGEMAEFGSGKFQASFENEVFKLILNNEISKPFITPYGYHIVKRLSHSPVPSDKNDPAFQFDLRRFIQQDSRINIARDLFVKEIFKQTNYKKLKLISDADLFRYADSIVANPAAETSNIKRFPIANKTIATLGKTVLTGKDWLNFIRNYKGSGELYQGESNVALFETFVSGSVLNHYKNNLEDYNADFRYQMEEFKAGNVLFEIMEKNIWGKASGDAEGLEKTYAANKHKYLWAASAEALVFNCTDKARAEEAKKLLLKGENWRTIMEASNNNIMADSGRFELPQLLPAKISPDMKGGSLTDIIVDSTDGNASFVMILKAYNAGLQRNFEEARGMVINDYQLALEESWVNGLKKKYPVKVNESVFLSLLK